jgi:DNA repair protein RecN (Recombination protein N)
MLRSLAISNYALIESLEISFPDGLIIITGETGAGKSILLGALSLLLGSKADKDILKESEKNCVVEALFTLEPSPETDAVFALHSMEPVSEMLIRRVITPNGRTRSFINDEPVSVQFLKDISEKIIDIHAQHEHLLIGDNRFQLSVLDSYAGNRDLLEKYRISYNRVKELKRERATLTERLSREEQEFEYNKYQFSQLEEARLSPGELEDIEREFRMLSNAEEIKLTLSQVDLLFNSNGISIIQTLRECVSLLTKISSSLPGSAQLCERLESCRIELKDIERESSVLAESVSVNPERTLLLEGRISAIYDLLNKHRADRVEELIEIRDKLSERLYFGDSLREQLKRIESEVESSEAEMRSISEELSSSRYEASESFRREMLSRVRELEMPHASFEVSLSKTGEYDLYGENSVSFLFSANRSVLARELSKVASGGELSRIMLCLKALMARGKKMPTLIFDEIDSGVSGSIADRMGSLIDELSLNMQVFAITHLPQIASKGNCHLLVYKDSADNNKVSTNIKKIEKRERVLEIARMLSGSELTDAAVANAEVFLGI